MGNIETSYQPIPTTYKNPTLLFSIIIFLIFFSAIITSYALSMFPSLSIFPEAVTNSFLLTLILLPLLFLLIFRPFQSYIARLNALERKLEQDAMTDELTGLLNRRGLFTIAQNQCVLATRNNFDISFIFIDIADLKTINDKYGHKTGDTALVDTANILMQSFRTSDIIGRIGGDDFIAIAACPTDTASSLVTKRLRDNLEAHNENPDIPYKLSLNIDLIMYDHDNPCSIDDMLTTADKLMYEQKRKKKINKDKEKSI